MKYITGGRIVMPDGMITGKALAFDGKISGIIEASDIPDGADVIDAGGQFVAPGFVDIHIHGYLGQDASDGDPEGLRIMAGGIAKNGVTSFLPTTMTVPVPQLERAFDAARGARDESRSWNGAEILGVHAEGPFISPDKKGAQAAENIKAPDAGFALRHKDIIKIMTLAPEMDAGYRAIREIRGNSGMLLSMGHTGATFEQANGGIEAGIGHATHLFNGMTGLDHRKPGVVGAALSGNVTTELIADMFHVHRGLFGLLYHIKGDRLILITDCIRAGGRPDGEYDLGGQPVSVKGIECRLADGTIAGSVLRMNHAVRNFAGNAGIEVWQAVRLASLNPARVIGADGTKGSLEPGKDADIIIFDDDFEITRTIRGGRTIYEA